MRVLVIGPEWFYPITEFVHQAFLFNKHDAKFIYYQYASNEKQAYYVRKLKQIHLYNSFQNVIDGKIEKNIFENNNNEILKECKENIYDLIFIIKGNFIHSETIREIKQHNSKIKIYVWYMDDPFILWGDNNKYIFQRESIKSIKYFDKVFVFDDYFVDGIKYRLNKEIHYLPLAFDDHTYKKINLQKKYNIAFIGCQTEERYRYLKNIEEYGLTLFGGDWQDLNKYKMGDVIPVEKSNQIYNESLINFNFHINQTVYGANTRTFEVPGSGNFLLTDFRNAIAKHFEIGKEIDCYTSKDELKEKVKYYLENKDKAEEIANAGYKRAASEHTYKHRIKYVLELFNKTTRS